MVVFGQSCCSRAKVVLFLKKLLYSERWLYSGKCDSNGRANAVVFEKSGCIRAKRFYSVNVVVFGQKRLYSGKMVVIGQSYCIRAKMVVIRQSGCTRG